MFRRIDNFLKKHGGDFKFWAERAKQYAAWIQFLMTVYIAISVGSAGWSWYLLLIPVIGVLCLMDFRYVAKGEFGKMSKINPEWNELREDVKAIMKAIKETQ